MTAESYDADKIVVKLIATGLVEEKKHLSQIKVGEQKLNQLIYGKEVNIEIPIFL